jgi:hypothetical protein
MPHTLRHPCLQIYQAYPISFTALQGSPGHSAGKNFIKPIPQNPELYGKSA